MKTRTRPRPSEENQPQKCSSPQTDTARSAQCISKRHQISEGNPVTQGTDQRLVKTQLLDSESDEEHESTASKSTRFMTLTTAQTLTKMSCAAQTYTSLGNAAIRLAH
ncbi:hypothetical protein STEG23_019535, partial [Scotinomys teguina]